MYIMRRCATSSLGLDREDQGRPDQNPTLAGLADDEGPFFDIVHVIPLVELLEPAMPVIAGRKT
jgi:hypothetical protein